MKIKKNWNLIGQEDFCACLFKINWLFLFFSLLSKYIQKIKFKINTVKWDWRLKNVQIQFAERIFVSAGACLLYDAWVLFLLLMFIYTQNIKVRYKWTPFNIIFKQDQWHDFLKKSKNHAFGSFLTDLDQLCPNGFFPVKSGCATHHPNWTPNTVTSFGKKQEPIPR